VVPAVPPDPLRPAAAELLPPRPARDEALPLDPLVLPPLVLPPLEPESSPLLPAVVFGSLPLSLSLHPAPFSANAAVATSPNLRNTITNHLVQNSVSRTEHSKPYC
jgi:hypothetical protein